MRGAWIWRVATVFFLANLVAIVAAIMSGVADGNPAHRFEEKEAITILSAIQLAATALAAWMVHRLRRHGSTTRREGRDAVFWGLSAAGFLFLMLDEVFQFHEGLDTAIVRLWGGSGDPMLDGVATAIYGVIAAAVTYRYRREILRYPATLRLFVLGGFFLAATSLLNIGEATATGIVIEESAKLMGVVSFLLGFLAAFDGALRETDVADAAPIFHEESRVLEATVPAHGSWPPSEHGSGGPTTSRDGDPSAAGAGTSTSPGDGNPYTAGGERPTRSGNGRRRTVGSGSGSPREGG